MFDLFLISIMIFLVLDNVNRIFLYFSLLIKQK